MKKVYGLQFNALRSTEALSESFRYPLTLLSQRSPANPKALVCKPVVLYTVNFKMQNRFTGPREYNYCPAD